MATSSFLLLLLLPPLPVTPQCRQFRGPPCSRAPPAPSTHPLGWGFDVTTLTPPGGRVLLLEGPPGATQCHLCWDHWAGGQSEGQVGVQGQGGGHRRGRWVRVPPGVQQWRSGSHCQRSQRVATGTQALGSLVASLQEVASGWQGGLRVGAGGAVLAGSHSQVAQFGLQRLQQDRVDFASFDLRCRHYWVSASPHPRLDPHFLRALRSLPLNFTPSTAPDFAELLATYGTHVVAAARLGGRLLSVTALRTCQTTMATGGTQEVADCLRAELWAGSSSAGASAMATACRKAREASGSTASFHELFSDRHLEVSGGLPLGDLLYGRPTALKDWLKSLGVAPGLVDADLRPLHTLLPHHNPRREALQAAVGHYIRWRGLRTNDTLQDGPHCAPSSHVTSGCCSRQRGVARASVRVGRGQGWRGDHVSRTDAYVTVELGGQRGRTQTLWNNERPNWEAQLELGWVELGARGARLRVEVWDEDGGWDDDLLGACEVAVEAGGGSHNLVCFPGGGRLEFGYRLTCGPALGGPTCQDYVPLAPVRRGPQGWRSGRWPPGPEEWPKEEEEEEEDEEEEVETQYKGNQHGASGDQGESGDYEKMEMEERLWDPQDTPLAPQEPPSGSGEAP